MKRILSILTTFILIGVYGQENPSSFPYGIETEEATTPSGVVTLSQVNGKLDSIQLLNWNSTRLEIKDQGTTPYNVNTLFSGTSGSITQSAVGSNLPYQSKWLVKSYKLDSNNSIQEAYDIADNSLTPTKLYIRKYRGGTWSQWRQVFTDSDFGVSDIADWNSAYGWGDHSLAGYTTETWVEDNFMPLTHAANGVTSTNITNWNTAYTNTHSHSNKDELDDITGTSITNWDNAYLHSTNTSNPHSTSILKLTDTPANYTGAAKRLLSVNTAANGVEFRTLTPTDVSLSDNSILSASGGTFSSIPVESTTTGANSIVRRTSTGTVRGEPAVHNFDLVTKSQMQEYISELPQGSVSIISTGGDWVRAALTGDVTAPQNSNSTTIAPNAVTNSKLATMSGNTLKGRATSSGNPQDLTPIEARQILSVGKREVWDLDSFTLPASSLGTPQTFNAVPIMSICPVLEEGWVDWEITWKDGLETYKISSIDSFSVRLVYPHAVQCLSVTGVTRAEAGLTINKTTNQPKLILYY